MKNIQEELEGRLRTVGAERLSLERRLAELQKVEDALKVLLKEEAFRFRTQQLELLPVKSVNGRKVLGQTPISRFLAKALGDGKSLSLTELAQLAQADGIDFQGKNPKRVFHFALVGLKHTGYAEMIGPSVWRLTPKALAKGDQEGKQIPVHP